MKQLNKILCEQKFLVNFWCFAKSYNDRGKHNRFNKFYKRLKQKTGIEHYIDDYLNQNKYFTYCQRQVEGQSICDKQCDHCKEYYAPLENQNK